MKTAPKTRERTAAAAVSRRVPVRGARSDAALLALFRALAVEAGSEIMRVYDKGCTVESKADQSPVTEADRRGEAVILTGLRAACPELVCVAEEEMSCGKVVPTACETFILIDPLDGTREFVARNPDFTVNIALVRGGVPVLGVVYAPARRTLYAGRLEAGRERAADGGPGGKAWIYRVDGEDRCGRGRRIGGDACRSPGRHGARIVASRSHRTRETDDYIDGFSGAEVVSVGSSLKFCLLAAGKADLYPRFGRTMEWDTAAGDAILRAAGGMTVTLDGEPLTYGKRGGTDADFANPWFIASADRKPDAMGPGAGHARKPAADAPADAGDQPLRTDAAPDAAGASHRQSSRSRRA